MSTNKKVTIMAKAIPKIPKKFPLRAVSGDDNPLRASIKSTPEIKYNDAAKLVVIIELFLFSFFCTFAAFSVLLKNHQKYLLRQVLSPQTQEC